ncbi:putative quinone oxidoreductase YhfP [Desulfamplus magnetovallimortis]|uniref:Putative quinone oxidoreductase YhfP n=1 Tax=Desulfamplus magnetovallimortis TaxID=1246637 RepID=A0A1W1HCU2_9BACT|nr:YhdH/YhfP family quinone oxidoreductase [Desulfamplus magnetovallimortis]SLM30280.1 putative quinone oxidoreductase YhfP [Desulfamplus magnetovallimortis]
MNNTPFKAFIVEEISGNTFRRFTGEKKVEDLPDGDLLIRVQYSSLNYKDALSATGNRGVTRRYPHTPGIDASGVVQESRSDLFKAGDEVIVTSYDLGMNTSGGYGQYIRVPESWAVKLPDGMSLKESMILGTAGFTAGMSVFFIKDQVSSENGDILVTGSTGGVGTIAVALLSCLGYRVTAVTGKPDAVDFLSTLGASFVLSREDVTKGGDQPMMKARWNGVVDTVGGDILASSIKSTRPWGVVTCCGLVASPDLSVNVFPFILRGVKLVGIDSQNCPMNIRTKIWHLFANEWKLSFPDGFYREITLDDLDENIDLILKGKQKGRVIVNMSN